MSEPLKLPARLDLSAANDLVESLRKVEGDILLDASEVSHLGALCLQSLVAASRKASANGHKFQMDGASDKVLEQMKYMGATPDQLAEGTI